MSLFYKKPFLQSQTNFNNIKLSSLSLQSLSWLALNWEILFDDAEEIQKMRTG